jgi:hypothetical protein
MTETGWVLEASHEPLYWTGRGPHGFSRKPEDAIRFARREDAEIAKFWLCKNFALRSVQHSWDTLPGWKTQTDVGPDVPGGGAQ